MDHDVTPTGPAPAPQHAGQTAQLESVSTLLQASPNQPSLDAEDAAIYEKLKARRRQRRRKKIQRRLIIGGIAAALLVIAVVSVWVATRQPETDLGNEVVTETVMRGTYTTSVDATGTLEPLSASVVTPEITGTIAELRVTAGQQVNKGDVLFTIKNDDIDREIADAKRALDQAKSDLASAQRAAAALEAASEEGTPSNGEDGIVAAKRAVETAQSSYDKAVTAGEKRTVTAPSSGSIVALNAQVGAAVGDPNQSSYDASKPLVQIADLSQMKVNIQVDEANISKVQQGQQAQVSFSAFEDLTLNGTVNSIASIATGTNQGEAMGYGGEAPAVNFTVNVLIPQPDARLKPGMSARVNLITEHIEDVIMVPIAALMTDDGTNYYVNVETNPETHSYVRKNVKVFAKNEDTAVVGKPADSSADMETAPLSEGDVLVVSGGMPSEEGAETGADMGSAEATPYTGEGGSSSTEGEASGADSAAEAPKGEEAADASKGDTGSAA
ncbi:efflux RND transporter periplasmic adaptor subunit [Collinsella sp. zg1085]|uniref:efflux RND transporter periplasmic adaptor subunit n=1 Tax=Collinsella sp. zg1085 TaxID=2844380 RepID=UPI001C0CBAF4|nr:efflux RND transporter periplasmic adaptor subunit [Collinsella sp. zg1085]QWT17157.1 efflux RND transporter periplasmic adaptor subunit [Collinsella sp. zg1085]